VDDPAAVSLALLQQAGVAGLDAGTLAARLTVPVEEVAARLGSHRELLAFGREPVWYVARAALDEAAAAAAEALRRFHVDNPLRPGMPREELRRRVLGRAPEGAFEHVLAGLERAGTARAGADVVALAGHQVRLSGPEQDARTALAEAARAAGLEGVELERLASTRTPRPLLERVSKVLLDGGELRRVGGALVDAGALDQLKARVRERWPPGSRVDVGAFKEMTGLSRKFTIPLLEYLDRERVTRRSGNDRLVLS
jgi:selenocysteine-specific elongation factor